MKLKQHTMVKWHLDSTENYNNLFLDKYSYIYIYVINVILTAQFMDNLAHTNKWDQQFIERMYM